MGMRQWLEDPENKRVVVGGGFGVVAAFGAALIAGAVYLIILKSILGSMMMTP